MCGLGVPVVCKSGHKKLLMWLDGCKMGLTVESEEGEVRSSTPAVVPGAAPALAKAGSAD